MSLRKKKNHSLLHCFLLFLTLCLLKLRASYPFVCVCKLVPKKKKVDPHSDSDKRLLIDVLMFSDKRPRSIPLSPTSSPTQSDTLEGTADSCPSVQLPPRGPGWPKKAAKTLKAGFVGRHYVPPGDFPPLVMHYSFRGVRPRHGCDLHAAPRTGRGAHGNGC